MAIPVMSRLPCRSVCRVFALRAILFSFRIKCGGLCTRMAASLLPRRRLRPYGRADQQPQQGQLVHPVRHMPRTKESASTKP